GELALLVRFVEARRGMDDGRWREERIKRLAKAVEALSGGRIAGDHANELAGLIISYAESRAERTKKRIENLAKEVGVSWEEVWSIVEFVLGDMYCLARDCADERIVRKFVAPALELIMLDKALNKEFDREEALLLFGEMYATAIAGDGSVGPDVVVLTVGGELGGGAALLRLAALYLLSQLLPDGLKFGVRVYVGEGVYKIAAFGENAARFMRLLAVSAPSAGGKYLSEKFNEFVKEARVEVRLNENSIRLTDKGRVAADLIISEGGAAVKYNVYLRKDDILLQFRSADRSRVELAARLLRLVGVSAEVRKEGGSDVWYIYAYTDMLAAGREKLKDALAKIVREAAARGWIDAGKAGRWLKKLEEGLTLREGWPRYHVGLNDGALEVIYKTTNPSNIEREAQRFGEMGLVEGVHFSVKKPEKDGEEGYVSVLKEGLAYAAWLSIHGEGERQKLAAEFVSYILQRAKEEGEEVYEKAREIVKEGKARGSLTLKGFEKEVEVDGRKHVVKVIDGGAEFDVGKTGKILLRLIITAEVDGVGREYVITYGRYGEDNVALGFAEARANAPGGRETDAERLAAVVEALTGKKPKIHRRSDGRIIIECGRSHLNGFMRYAELADAITRWLEETGR
ncbi:MAG: PaRep2b protein, partial [Pyrobaculum sp.]|nr:PaRep2b protein [Pyrobaculum sp.]